MDEDNTSGSENTGDSGFDKETTITLNKKESL